MTGNHSNEEEGHGSDDGTTTPMVVEDAAVVDDAGGGGGIIAKTKKKNIVIGPLSLPSSWRIPSAAQQKKYRLTALPADFQPTKEEQDLLMMYEAIKVYEKQSSRLKEEAARAKLDARNVEYQKKVALKQREKEKKKAERKKKRQEKEKTKRAARAAAVGGEEIGAHEDSEEDSLASGESSEGESDEEESDADMDTGDDKNKHILREEKIQRLHDEVEEMKQETVDKEEILREELLTTNEGYEDDGPSIRKRSRMDDQYNEVAPKSLIANLSSAKTPPHDFSKSLKFNAIHGKTLFPNIHTEEKFWEPPIDATSPFDGAFTVDLEDFDVTEAQNGVGNNTIAIKFMAPKDSKRFSLNIAAPDHDDFDSILFHFNPRQKRGGQLVLNNKAEGTWGQAVNIPLSQLPMVFGTQSCTLIIQINGDGFDCFLDDKHAARLEHRRELPSGKFNLVLNFPGTDDYGNPEKWMVFKVWWGNKAIMADSDLSGVPGYNSYSSVHPRKLFISGLRKIRTEAEIDLRKAELERAFRRYGGDRGVSVIAPKNSTFAFVEMESERQSDLALQQMQNEFPRISRARRSKHEALQEERAAKESAGNSKANPNTHASSKKTAKKQTTDWD